MCRPLSSSTIDNSNCWYDCILSSYPGGPGNYNLIVFPYHEVVLLDAEKLEEVSECERRERPEGEVGEAVRGRRRGAALRERHCLHCHEVLHQQVPLVVPERGLEFIAHFLGKNYST